MGKITFKSLGKIVNGQDGAIFGAYLFRFNATGKCTVFSFPGLQRLSDFMLDSLQLLTPHSNTVCFGAEKYSPEDEFPLLYSNVYNTYAKAQDRWEGTCCVYRIWREGDGFCSRLVQIIRIGFAGEKGLWCSEQVQDVRPYGNFAVDPIRRRLYVFTMLDEAKKTRFFEFALPKSPCRAEEPEWVVLEQKDILSSFDSSYMHYMQGAACRDGVLVSSEGFTNDPENAPVLRVFRMTEQRQCEKIVLGEYGLSIEPELLEYVGDELYYADNHGNFYQILKEE